MGCSAQDFKELEGLLAANIQTDRSEEGV